MTREELEKEAEEKYGEVDREFMDCQDESEIFNLGYLAGAEPREKEIKSLGERCLQLQKDKGELIDKTRELERKIASIRGSHRVDLAKLNARIEQVERLKKENARLKEINTHTLSQLNLDNGELITELTKAKELLKRWIELSKPKLEGYPIPPIQEQTEQFLSEVEK